MNSIKIIKNRSDIGAGTRGADMGIDAIEIAAINEDNNYFNRYDFVDVPTLNEAIYNKQKATFAKRIGSVLQVCENLANVVEATLKKEQFPIVLSGDHSSALGTISGLKMAYPQKRIGVVWIDAHADIHSPYTTPSGNVHGMPLSVVLSDDNLDKKINQLSKETSEKWEALKNIGNISPKIKHEDIVYFGVRDTEAPEDYAIAKNNMKNYTVSEVRYRGLETCVEEALGRLDHCELIYVSFDVDSMDCDLVSRGTGTPVSKGFDKYEIISIIDKIIESKKMTCLEIVEINPCLDNKGNEMAKTAFSVLNSCTQTIENVYQIN